MVADRTGWDHGGVPTSGQRPDEQCEDGSMRDLSTLPKAHLHLHFAGSMRHETLLELAGRDGIHLPAALTAEWPPQLSGADEKGWFRFQRLYDVARSVLRTPGDVYRLVLEAAEDDAADGSVWTELQVDPSGYAHQFGGITSFTELVLDAVTAASARTGVQISLIIAANRTRHPLDARTLARLAGQYVGRGVHGFGLSNDERRGTTGEFAPAFRIAERAGLLRMPHGGELRGAAHVSECLDSLRPDRIGHGVRSVEDPALVERIAEAGIALEVCPTSNVSLGVYRTLEEIPVRELISAGVRVALGADDPLLFGPRLLGQYEALRRHQQFSDHELAELAAMSLRASAAPDELIREADARIKDWLLQCTAPTCEDIGHE